MPLIGIISPSARGTTTDLQQLLPPEIRLEQSELNVSTGSEDELETALAAYESHVAEWARRGADIVHPAGAPPLLLGFDGEQACVTSWEDRYGVDIFTNGMSQVAALRALGARRILGLTYFAGAVNGRFRAYFQQAGFDIVAMDGMDVPFGRVPEVPESDVRAFISEHVGAHRNLDAVYLLGPAWRTFGLLEGLEGEFSIPFVHHTCAQAWEIQRRLGVRFPVSGRGKLTAELPPSCEGNGSAAKTV